MATDIEKARADAAEEIHRHLSGRAFSDPVLAALAKVAGLELREAKSDKARMEWYDRCVSLARSSSSPGSTVAKSKYSAAREEHHNG